MVSRCKLHPACENMYNEILNQLSNSEPMFFLLFLDISAQTCREVKAPHGHAWQPICSQQGKSSPTEE